MRQLMRTGVGEIKSKLEMTMTRMAVMCAATISIFLGTSANAQMKIDMAAFACGDLASMAPDEFVVIGSWMSGYYNAKRNNTMIDVRQLQENTKNVVVYCKSNPTATVMKAIETLSAAQK